VIKKKICMLGNPGVGKTSLVRQFVYSAFSDKYLATLGVKIDQKTVTVGQQEVNLLLWDLEGLTDLRALQTAYLRGAAGYLLVADGTRVATLETIARLQQQIEELLGKMPFALALNKKDLAGEWPTAEERLSELAHNGWRIFRTSAKTGENVEQAFMDLAARLV